MTIRTDLIKKYVSKILATVFFIVFFFCVLTTSVSAEGASVMVDTDAVRYQDGRVIVPVRIEADETIGKYYVEIYFDDSRLSYVSGADAQNNGILTLSGNGIEKAIRYELVFDAVSGGSAGIAVGRTEVSPYGSDELLDVKSDINKSIALEGEDVGNNDFASREKLAGISAETGVALNGIVSMGGKEYYLIDQSLSVPSEVTWKYRTMEGSFEGNPVTYLTDKKKNVQLLYMLDRQKNPVCFAVGKDGMLYSASFRTNSKGKRFFAVPLAGCLEVPDEIQSVEHADEYIVYAINENGKAYYCFSDNNGILTKWEPGMETLINEAYEKREERDAGIDVIIIIGASVLTLVIFGVFYYVFFKIRDKDRKGTVTDKTVRDSENAEPADTPVSESESDTPTVLSLEAETDSDAPAAALAAETDSDAQTALSLAAETDSDAQTALSLAEESEPDSQAAAPAAESEPDVSTAPSPTEGYTAVLTEDPEFEASMLTGIEPEGEERKAVISVRDVSMVFKAASANVSGIKDYVVQRLNRKISRMMFTALQNVSFDVYKGEVVGIIGTNGSGKSTLLKIISGAMKPSGGTVQIKKEDVQLLTIGTGFDTELTAKENVYLNGAIIGYTKEFIDEHYDEIVKFAELENFMDEKVKNFSSGMVSRLGFSIATVGNAAEILILDEVLAVGDEFFKKKSLARVKEMIHGGSTVLIVSHNMNTILENCSKVIWLEKSRLRMIGKPEIVCKAYKELGV